MTLPSELLQVATILAFPALALLFVFFVTRQRCSRRWAMFVAPILALSALWLVRGHTLFGIAVIGCPMGERMVEVPPSIFETYGDQQICVADNIATRIAEAIAASRPVLQLFSIGLTWLLCVGIILLNRSTDNKPKQLSRPIE
jgi:hypothetical protein